MKTISSQGHRLKSFVVFAVTFWLAVLNVFAAGAMAAAKTPSAAVALYGVHELSFVGPHFQATENPVRDVEFYTEWQHESGAPTYRIHGFWDGDGAGGNVGNVFRVRFCPTKAGRWNLIRVTSNRAELKGQKEGYAVAYAPSSQKGFWEPDAASPGRRWYRRSDNTHPFIVGNTHYSFLTERSDTGPTGSDIATDVRSNAAFFKKLWFSITGDRYPHPVDKPFLDPLGRPTDNGNFSHRPNPRWFHKRVDRAVQTALQEDLIADLILCGPDTEDSRSVLRAAENAGDRLPLLRYIAARYGSFPNVWICLANEYDINRGQFRSVRTQRRRQFVVAPPEDRRRDYVLETGACLNVRKYFLRCSL